MSLASSGLFVAATPGFLLARRTVKEHTRSRRAAGTVRCHSLSPSLKYERVKLFPHLLALTVCYRHDVVSTAGVTDWEP